MSGLPVTTLGKLMAQVGVKVCFRLFLLPSVSLSLSCSLTQSSLSIPTLFLPIPSPFSPLKPTVLSTCRRNFARVRKLRNLVSGEEVGRVKERKSEVVTVEMHPVLASWTEDAPSLLLCSRTLSLAGIQPYL